MIVDSPNSFNVTIGAETRVPEEGDAQVVIPATILPVVLSLKPLQTTISTTDTLTQSNIYVASALSANAVSFQSLFGTLGAGLWELEMSLITLFNFVPAPGSFIGAAILLNQNSVDKQMVRRFGSIGSFVDNQRMRILLRNKATLLIELGSTGVGQNIDSIAIVNAVRII